MKKKTKNFVDAKYIGVAYTVKAGCVTIANKNIIVSENESKSIYPLQRLIRLVQIGKDDETKLIFELDLYIL